MTGHLWMIAKTFLKSQLDNYVLPGTLSGTEILLLYMAQWKRNVARVTFGAMYILRSQADLPKLEKVLMFRSSDRPVTDRETM
jgi:hypothetical protein